MNHGAARGDPLGPALLQCHTYLVRYRVYKVAHDLGLASKIVLLYLDSVGLTHRSASSVLREEAKAVLDTVRIVDIKREARAQAAQNRQRGPMGQQFWYQSTDDYGYVLGPLQWVGPEVLTTTEAAAAVGVSPSTLRQWVRRGHLKPAGWQGKQRTFTAEAVLAADRATDSRNKQPGTVGHRHRDRHYLAADGHRGVSSANLTELIDATEAARSAGVAPATIRAWVHRGHLHPRGQGGKRLFLRQDVLRLARRGPHRTRPKPTVF